MTLCELCQYVEEASRKREWWAWRCLVSPQPTPNQFVVADPFLIEPPFKKCKDVNTTGECELFEPMKENENEKQ